MTSKTFQVSSRHEALESCRLAEISTSIARACQGRADRHFAAGRRSRGDFYLNAAARHTATARALKSQALEWILSSDYTAA